MSERIKKLIAETRRAFRAPTLKQKEAYGRLVLALCAASVIGAVTVMFTESSVAFFVVFKVGALVFWGVILFWFGAILSKGE